MLALVFFISSITLYSKACIFGLFVVVFGCKLLALLLVVGVLGLMLFAVGFDVLDLLLLDETMVLDLLLEWLELGCLVSKWEQGV
jgi:hypothetical protein